MWRLQRTLSKTVWLTLSIARPAMGREYADTASEYATSIPGSSAEIFDTVRSNLSDLFKAQPLALGAIGIAIGAGIAAALPATEIEADYLGETSDTVRKKAAQFCRTNRPRNICCRKRCQGR